METISSMSDGCDFPTAYNFEKNRRRSFPAYGVLYLDNGRELAKNGMYWTEHDIICYFCGKSFGNWREHGSNIEEYHRSVSPACPMACLSRLPFAGPFNIPILENSQEDLITFAGLQVVDDDNGDVYDVCSNAQELWDKFHVQMRLIRREMTIPQMPGKFSLYAFPYIRRKTFDKYPHETLIMSMVISGLFYSGVSDFVICFCCGVGIRRWSLENNPDIEHARQSPHCPYLTKVKGDEFMTAALRQD